MQDVSEVGRLDIMGHEWVVNSFRPDADPGGTYDLGQCDTNQQQIYVAYCHCNGTLLPLSLQRASFLHELTHAVDWYAGTGLTEEQVEVFSNVLFQVIVHNPEALDFRGTPAVEGVGNA